MASAGAQADDDCHETPDLGRPLGDPPIIRRADWCWATALSDQWSQHLQKTGVLKRSERVSALQIAVINALSQGHAPSLSLQTQSTPVSATQSVIDWLGKHRVGLCKESDLPQTLDSADEIVPRPSWSVGGSFGSNDPNCKRGPPMNPYTSHGDVRQILYKTEESFWIKKFASVCDIMKMTDLHPQIEFSQIRQEAIQSGGDIPPDSASSEKFRLAIDEGLSEGRVVNVGIRSRALRANGPGGLHYVTVVQRKRDKFGECQYKVRTYWSKEICSQMAHPELCSEGHYFLSRREIIDNGSTAIRLTGKSK